jgi:hypothetical protein
LGFKFLGHEVDRLDSLSAGLFEHGSHGKFYTIVEENFLFW